jgi:hypothetical protein
MAEKKIEIRIAATGGQQAAAEVRKVESAVEDISPSAEKSADSMDDLRERMEAVKNKASDLKQEAENLNEEIATNTSRNNVARAATIGLAVGGAILSKTFGEIAKGIQSIDSEKLRELDAAMADQVESAKGWAEALSDPLNALQRLISGGTVGEAFGDLNDQLSRNAKMQEEAIDRMIQNGRRTAAEISALVKEIAAANAILDAKDAADGAERDAADAARVRGGAAPEDVRAERAAFDRDRELERLNRSLDPKATAAQAKFDDAQKAQGNAEDVEDNPRATAEDRAKAIKAAKDARAAFDEAKREFDAAKAVVIEQRRGVNAKYESEIGDAAGDKSTRLKREQQQAEAKARREQEAAAREADQSAAGRNRDLAGVGRDAVSLIPKGASDKARAAVESAAAKLNDGDQGGELAALLKLVEQMAGYIEGTQGKESANAVKISQLEARIAALRNNGKK